MSGHKENQTRVMKTNESEHYQVMTHSCKMCTKNFDKYF